MSAELILRLLSASVAASRHAARIIRQIAQGGDLKIKDKVCNYIHKGRTGDELPMLTDDVLMCS